MEVTKNGRTFTSTGEYRKPTQGEYFVQAEHGSSIGDPPSVGRQGHAQSANTTIDEGRRVILREVSTKYYVAKITSIKGYRQDGGHEFCIGLKGEGDRIQVDPVESELMYEGVALESSGEYRHPRKGDYFLADSDAVRLHTTTASRPILKANGNWSEDRVILRKKKIPNTGVIFQTEEEFKRGANFCMYLEEWTEV